MKFAKFVVSLVVLFTSFATQAQWVTGSVASNAQTIADAGAGQLVQLQLTETAGTVTTVIVYDLNSTTTTNVVVPGFTGVQQYTTNLVTTWTDSVGVSRSKTNSMLFRAPLVVAATTNEANRLYTIRIPANGTIVLDPPTSLGYVRGLTIRSIGSSVAFNGRIIAN